MIKVAILGAESTGKTTLSLALAKKYGGFVAEEFLRVWVDRERRLPVFSDLGELILGQIERERRAELQKAVWCFCDTTPLVLKALSQHYFKGLDEKWNEDWDKKLALESYDVTILCNNDFDWQPDPQRDGPQAQQAIQQEITRLLKRYKVPYLRAEGSIEQRMSLITAQLDQISSKRLG